MKENYKPARWPLAVGGVIIVLGGLLYFYLLFKDKKDTAVFSGTAADKISENYFYSVLSGEKVKTEEESQPDAVGVMIDNHPAARPLTGLDLAKVVYEVPVEGEFTRFMAIFDSKQNVDKVGPVRSARPYYLDWIQEYGDGLYMHCGGSPEALTLIKQRDIFDANEFAWGKYYWRDQARGAPHNLYTNSAKWSELLANYSGKRKDTAWQGWVYGDLDANIFNESASAVQLDYGYGEKINWKYNSGISMYARQTTDSRETVAPVFADNVIVQYVKMKVIDDYGRKELAAIGTGEARIFRDGKMVRGFWKKDSATGRTRFYVKAALANPTSTVTEEKEVVLRPGITWIQVVPNDLSVVITN